jgi:uncharacterized protein (DUF488 family)
LNNLEIRYSYISELAPTTEIRELQKSADSQAGENKRDRSKLGRIFAIVYKEKILKKFDFKGFIEKLEQIGANKIVFFCVEDKHEACHRSLVTNRLEQLGYKITHL